MSYWMRITKTSVTCPFCGRTYHFIDKTAAAYILINGCGCRESEDEAEDECDESRPDKAAS